MFDELVTVLENKKVNAEYFKLVFSSRKLSEKVLPGQFLNLQIEDDSRSGLLLRRPFSYYRVQGTKIEVLYEILGRGTALLAQKRRGHTLKALGPLGKPFTQQVKQKKHVLVAGGVGVPPLVFLAEALSSRLLRPRLDRRLAMTSLPHRGYPDPMERNSSMGLRGVPKGRRSNLQTSQARQTQEEEPFILLIGCKSKSEVLPKRELTHVKGPVFYATDDGSYGKKGFVTVLLREVLEREDPRSLFIQTCGPHAMMVNVIKLAKEFGAEGEASIDERMACGVGACLGCVVETKEGFKTSCVEGPVFSFDRLVNYG